MVKKRRGIKIEMYKIRSITKKNHLYLEFLNRKTREKYDDMV